nr:hypothetical protein [uncultured Fluviicola sp.]
MNSLRKGALTLLVLQLTFMSCGQTTTQQLPPEEISNRVAYVHGNDFVLNNPTLVVAFGKVMTDRIEYRVAEQAESEKYPLLSSFPLMTKVNPTIQGANFANFDVNTFNPLVYNLDFFSNRTQVFRIDNTSYIMVLHPNTRN